MSTPRRKEGYGWYEGYEFCSVLTGAASGGFLPPLQVQGNDAGFWHGIDKAVARVDVGPVDGKEALVQLVAAGRAKYPELGEAGPVTLDGGGVSASSESRDGSDDSSELHYEY